MIVSCPECNGKVSTDAAACPHCGKPREKSVPHAIPVAEIVQIPERPILRKRRFGFLGRQPGAWPQGRPGGDAGHAVVQSGWHARVEKSQASKTGIGWFIGGALLGVLVALIGVIPAVEEYVALKRYESASARWIGLEEEAYNRANHEDRDMYLQKAKAAIAEGFKARLEMEDAKSRGRTTWVFMPIGGVIAFLCILMAIFIKMR